MKYIRKFDSRNTAVTAADSLTNSLFYVDDLRGKYKKCIYNKVSLENANYKPSITIYLNNGDWNVSTDIRPQTTFGYEIFKSTTSRNSKDIKEICIVTENLTMIDFYIATNFETDHVEDSNVDCFAVCTLNDGLKNVYTERILSDCNANFMNNKSRFYNIIGHNLDANFKATVFDNINYFKHITYNLYKNRNIIYISHFPLHDAISSTESCLIIPTSNYYDIRVVDGMFIEDEYTPTKITGEPTNEPTDVSGNQTSGPSSQPTTTTSPPSGTTTPEP